MGSVVVYHFEVVDPKTGEHSRSRRPALRSTIESLGARPLMDTAQVVEHAALDRAGYLPAPDPRR